MPLKSRIIDAQLVIFDHNEQQTAIKTLHAGLGRGHFGITKTILKVGERYWWPGFANDIRQFVKACKACQIFKPSNKAMTTNGIGQRSFYKRLT